MLGKADITRGEERGGEITCGQPAGNNVAGTESGRQRAGREGAHLHERNQPGLGAVAGKHTLKKTAWLLGSVLSSAAISCPSWPAARS